MPAMGYQDRITGKYQSLRFAEFPIALVMSPPAGWRVRWVRLARPNCEDAHWLLLLKRV